MEANGYYKRTDGAWRPKRSHRARSSKKAERETREMRGITVSCFGCFSWVYHLLHTEILPAFLGFWGEWMDYNVTASGRYSPISKSQTAPFYPILNLFCSLFITLSKSDMNLYIVSFLFPFSRQQAPLGGLVFFCCWLPSAWGCCRHTMGSRGGSAAIITNKVYVYL